MLQYKDPRAEKSLKICVCSFFGLTVFLCHRQEDFLDLTVCVCGVSSLEEALWNMFVEEELFEGNNLYRCARCSRLVTAAKVSTSNARYDFEKVLFFKFSLLSKMFSFAVSQSAKLKQLPPFMTMSLLRFSFDFAKCERYKETGRYAFPLTINLRPFCEQVPERF